MIYVQLDVVLLPCLIEWLKHCPLMSSAGIKGRRPFYRGGQVCRVSGLLRMGWTLSSSVKLQDYTSYRAVAPNISSGEREKM